MTEFLLELYIARTDAVAARAAARGARLAADKLAAHGPAVRCVRSIFVAEDETCFLFYAAASADAVRTTAQRAGLPFDHVSEVVAESNCDPMATKA